MKPTLVTGATGFLGWHVARKLLARGQKVRALVRPSSKVRELDVEVVTGDLRDAGFVGTRGSPVADVVFHVAADYRLWAKDESELYHSNVEGTRNLLEAARECRSGSRGLHQHSGLHRNSRGWRGTKIVAIRLEEMTGAYKRSKFLAEQVALLIRPLRIAGGDCESHGAHRRSRF